MSDLLVNNSMQAPAAQAAVAQAARPKAPAASRAAAPQAAPEAPSEPSVSPQDLGAAVAEALAEIAPRAGSLEFVVDDGSTIVRVVDRETKQLVRQIPSEEMVAIRRALERAEGILIRSKA